MSHKHKKPPLPEVSARSLDGSIMPKLLSRGEAAEFLGIKIQTLASWFVNKRYNLPVVKIGSCVFYKESDLLAFIEGNVVSASSNNFSNQF